MSASPAAPGPAPASRAAMPEGRVTVLWFPDWPVYALGQALGWDPLAPAAVTSEHRILACNAAARQAGVRTGMKQRHALATCPHLALAADDPAQQAAIHEDVVIALSEVAAGLETLRPGLIAFPTRPLASFYGSEDTAVELLLDTAVRLRADCSAATADDLVTAVWAARAGRTIPVGQGTAFVQSLPVSVLTSEPALGAPVELVDVLSQLGIRTLADFAALPRTDVAGRFGQQAVEWHRIACGEPGRAASPQQVEEPIAILHELPEPILHTDTAVFAARQAAHQLHNVLFRAGDACLRLVVRAHIHPPSGYTGPTVVERAWRCREPLTEEDTAQRVRWQLDGWITRMRGSARPGGRAPGGAGTAGGGTGPAGSTGGTGPTGGTGRARAGTRGYLDGGMGNYAGAGSGAGPDAGPDGTDFDGWGDGVAGIVALELVPLETVPAGSVVSALWGGPDEGIRAARAAAGRAQALIGTQGVRRAIHCGGRAVAGRVVTVAYGDEDPDNVRALSTTEWEGQLLAPLPARIGPPILDRDGNATTAAYARTTAVAHRRGQASPPGTALSAPGQAPTRGSIPPNPGPISPSPGQAQPVGAVYAPSIAHPSARVFLVDAAGTNVYVTGRGLMSAPPVTMVWGAQEPAVTGWAGPWPVDEKWWAEGRRYARLQLSTDEPGAYLLVCKGSHWRIEATY